MNRSEIGLTVAQLLLDLGAIKFARDRPIILAAGWASPVYVDCRMIVGDVASRRIVIRLALEVLGQAFPSNQIEVVVGAETAGIPFAAWIAEALGVPLAFVRKRPLGIGCNAQVEGGDVQNRRILLVDDLTTDGSSKVNFTRGLRAAGAIMADALTVFYHGIFPIASERLQEEGVNLIHLANWDDVLRAEKTRQFSDEDRATLLTFCADPTSWSLRYGGRGNSKKAIRAP